MPVSDITDLTPTAISDGLSQGHPVKVLYYCDWFKEYTSKIVLASPAALPATSPTMLVRSGTGEFLGRRDDESDLHSRLKERCDRLIVLPGRYRSREAAALLMRDLYRDKHYTEYDVFHLQLTQDPRFLPLAWRLPTVVTVHEPGRRHGQSGWELTPRALVERAVRRMYRRLANVIVVHTESGLRRLPKREAQKGVIIPHGVDIRRSDDSGPGRKILFFGRITNYKGLDILLAAMEQVWESIPDARLEILGSPSKDSKIRQWAEMSNDPRIQSTWDGYSSVELEKALADARAVCIPYLSASGSGVAADASGAEKLVVASNIEELREFAAHPDLLVEPGCPDDLARALVAVLSKEYDPAPVDPRRTWPAVALQYLAVYRSLVSARGSRKP